MTRAGETKTFLNTGGLRSGRASRLTGNLTGIGLAGLLVLSACSEPEVILPGKREDPRAILTDVEMAAPIDAEVAENRALPIRLPGISRNANWTQPTGTPATRTENAAYSGAMQLAWAAPIGAGDSRRNRITADPVVAGGRVFTLDAQARVTATALNGETAWARDLLPARDGAHDATGGGLAVAGNVLYVTSGFGLLTALNAATGAEIWQQKLEQTGTGAPTVYKGVVYLTSGDSTAWAVDAEDGRILWQLDSISSRNNVLGAPAPALNDQVAIFAFGSSELQAAFRGGGLRIWDAAIPGKRPGLSRTRVTDITGAPVISGTTVFAGTNEGRTVALSAATGERLWTANEGALWPLWAAGGSVFLISDRNELIRLSAEDGSRIWGVELPFFQKDKPKRQRDIFAHMGPVLAGGRLYVASSDGLIRAFDPTSGKLVGSAEIPGGATTAPVFAGGTMYVVSKNGTLYAFR
ncbi:PQQ-like beta-propeller repeat protein [Rhodalgimonas zhirmunskyi]|uniref:PQQ-like beta-propeller repeat protein n=1 Tax=Rhodalgimonas zhirmunskyi TaxID=2964767 RepID=A0AAJ1X6D4_9RHOB|nr:PQQ-binding-like beta-propeller repeat protein [Rhodoalgimonas zhirmunskyi]MDQ2093307.1 PQQ-like beta-propeller repeat protein [Rhodoalgimonas zhirmunskyi]